MAKSTAVGRTMWTAFLSKLEPGRSGPRDPEARIIYDNLFPREPRPTLAFPRTRERLENRGIGVEAVEVSELAKAEAGVTCCSPVFPRQ
jgi:hypothetical protein